MGQRSRGGFDLILDSGQLLMGFVFDRSAVTRSTEAPAIRTEIGPARLGDGPSAADTPRTIDSLEGGMGFSRRVEQAPNGYSYCLPGYTRAPGAILSPPGLLTEVTLPAAGSWDTNAIVDSHVLNDNIYLITQGRHILMMNGTAPNGPAAVVFDGGSGFRGWGATLFNNRLYIGGAFGGLAYHDLADSSWHGPAVSVPRAYPVSVAWRPLGVPTQVLVAVDPSAGWGARWCPIYADPMVASNWSAVVPVGTDRAYVATGAVAAPRHVYFYRADGVYDIDELGVRSYNIAPWIGENRDGNNGLWAMHTGAGLYYGHSQGLAYVPTSGEEQNDPQWAHPTWGLPYEGPIRGVATAGTLHQGWRLVSLFDNFGAATSYVCAGLPSGRAYGAATHVWHGAEASLPGMITHMKVLTPTWIGAWPMLLIATTDLGTPPVVHVYWQSLPKLGSPIQEMLLGGAFRPGPGASLFLPTDDWGRPAAIKTLLELDLVTANLSSTATLEAWAKADEGAWADQGTADLGAFTSFRPVSPVSGRSVSARIDCSGPAILRSLELRSALGIELREARTYSVVLGADDGLRTPRGAQWRDPERRLMDLRGLLGTIVTADDGTGPPMRARLIQVLPGSRRPIGAPTRAGAWTMTAELTLTVLDRPFRYDADDAFDTDRTWS